MSQEQIAIADMQCWVFRKAQSKWSMSAKKCMELFQKYDILGFISECYGLLHVSGYLAETGNIVCSIVRAKGKAPRNNT